MKGCRQTFATVFPPSPPFLSGFLLPVGGRGDDKRDWLALPAPPAGTRDPDPRGNLDRKPSFADYPERDQILRANVCEFRRGYA